MSPRSFKFYIKNLVIYAFIGSLVFGATVAIITKILRTPPKIVEEPGTYICYDKGLGSVILNRLYEAPPENRPELWKDIQLGLGVLPPTLTSYGKDNVLQTLEECGYSPSRDWVKKLFE